MATTKERNSEPIAGYRLLEPLGRGGFGEVWKCEAPGGLCKAIKFVDGGDLLGTGQAVAEELQAIQHIKALRHPFLLSIERVELIEDELVIVMELADHSLRELFRLRRDAGQPGIPRDELLRYLAEAADVLDLLKDRHGLQHLDIKPANLFVVSDHVKVADFGLVQSLQDRPSSQPLCAAQGKAANTRQGNQEYLSAITPLYAAPELFRGVITPFCDQYSLAVLYQELLTGRLPFEGRNYLQLALLHSTREPNLEPLPPRDRDILRRALAKEPQNRFPSCRDLVQALRGSEGDSRSALAPLAPSSVLRAPSFAGALRGYRILRNRGHSPAGETWEAERPDGRSCLVRVLYGFGRDPRREEQACTLLRNLRHPNLPALHIVPGDPGCLLLVTERIDTTLRDRFQERRAHGEHGVPRRQLLGWLRPAAEALDALAAQGVSHLALTPRHLLLDGGRVLLADCGLAPLFWLPAGLLEGQVQARYAAPEVLQRRPHPHSDVWSLAIIYQEMLTGVHPFVGRKPGQPLLTSLLRTDQSVLARALQTDPARRFGSCTELIAALEQATPGWGLRGEENGSTAGGVAPPHLAELIAEACDSLPLPEPETWTTTPEGLPVLQCTFAASLPPAGACSIFERFREQCKGQRLDGDDNSLTFQIGARAGFWRRWLGSRRPALLMEIRWDRPRPPSLYPEIVARIRPADGRHKPDLARLAEEGPVLLDELRRLLGGHSDRRKQERILWTAPVQAVVLGEDGRPGEAFTCQGKDLSLTGMGLYLPQVPPDARLQLHLSSPRHPEPVVLHGRCVRLDECGEGWFEAGVLFE
jgi:serine/threonine protein kinase